MMTWSYLIVTYLPLTCLEFFCAVTNFFSMLPYLDLTSVRYLMAKIIGHLEGGLFLGHAYWHWFQHYWFISVKVGKSGLEKSLYI